MILESDLSPLASDAKRPNPVAEILAEQLESRQVIAAIFSTDEGTKNHSLAVAEQYCLLAGAWIKQYPNSKAELVDTGLGALLHDIGKKAVPLEILRNSGPLLKIEWQVLKLHSNAGSHELSDTLDFRPIADTAKYHHEKWDGTGYPDGLKGEKIPPAARILAVIDTWDALIHDRAYRKAFSLPAALAIIIQESGSHFDPLVVALFVANIKLFQKTDPSRIS